MPSSSRHTEGEPCHGPVVCSARGTFCRLPQQTVLEISPFRGICSFKNLVNCDVESLMLFVQGSPSGSAAELSFLALPKSL